MPDVRQALAALRTSIPSKEFWGDGDAVPTPATLRLLLEAIEAAATDRALSQERLEVTGRHARREITKDEWLDHGTTNGRLRDQAEQSLDDALSRLVKHLNPPAPHA